MKGVIIGCMFFFLSVFSGYAAEYTVIQGDTISIVAQKLDCSIEGLALFNNIAAPKYIIRAGDKLRYVSKSDVQLAHDWIYEYLQGSALDNSEVVHMQQMMEALNKQNIQYNLSAEDDKNSIFADEVLILADAQVAR